METYLSAGEWQQKKVLKDLPQKQFLIKIFISGRRRKQIGRQTTSNARSTIIGAQEI